VRKVSLSLSLASIAIKDAPATMIAYFYFESFAVLISSAILLKLSAKG
jgi:hypothetical protein